MALIAIFVALLFIHSLVSGRLARTPVTTPIVFTAAGALTWLGFPSFGVGPAQADVFLTVAEVGLVLLLFTDASRTRLEVLRGIRALPLRLLSAGMLSTILLGAVAALVVFRKLTLWEAGILAAILAPTDAGLGQVIVSSPRVPIRIREALNVEAGLNDGLSVPFLLFFIALAGANEGGPGASLTRLVVEQLGYGVLVGLGIGLAGGALLGLAQRCGWMAEELRQLGVVALPLLCILASEAVAASMFIAAFVAGLAVQVSFREAGGHCVEFTETWGQVLNNSVFFLFGLMIARAWPDLGLDHVLYAVLSLTVVRMLPVAVALLGTGLSRATVAFMGWFGPRGLASIVLGLVYLEQVAGQAEPPAIRLAVMATVLLSIVAHGLSAKPGIGWLARRSGGPDGAAGDGATEPAH
jgi:NhaP-type Na+/H+ or K+/H+ antiporter